MTPAQIEVIVRFWYDPNAATAQDWSQHQHDFIKQLIKSGHLQFSRTSIDPRFEPNIEAFRPMIEALTSVELSRKVLKWELPPCST